MEQWIIEAKELAKNEAKEFVENMREVAITNHLDEVWFIEEVVNNIHKLKSSNSD